MPDQGIKNIIRGFLQVLLDEDADQVLQYVTDNVIWSSPDSTLSGKAGLKKYVEWLREANPEVGIKESGLGIIVNGDKAFTEQILSGVHNGRRWETLAICAYEFSGEKIKAIRTVYDRLFIARQVSRGLIVKKAMKKVTGAFSRGLVEY
jgi:predicted ester cyclase